MSDVTAGEAIGEALEPDGAGTTSEDVGAESVEVDLGTDVDAPVIDSGAEDAPVADSQFYKVSVGGVEQEVTLEDLRSGFMRQADYTRKTQEVAEMRQRLAQAEAIANSLDADPQGTLKALAEAFGVTPSEDGQFDESDPMEQRLRGLERQHQERIVAETRAQIDSEIDTLVSTYGDFDLAKVIQHAATNGMTVTSAYRDLHFDTIASKQREAEQIRGQKREAAAVHGGAHRTGVTEQQKPASSIREAWEQAKQALKV